MLIPDSGVEKVNRHYARFLEKRWRNLALRSAAFAAVLLIVPVNIHDLVSLRRWRHWGFYLGLVPAIAMVYVAMYGLLELQKINLRGPRDIPRTTLLAQARALLLAPRAMRLITFYSITACILAAAHALLSASEAKLGIFNATSRHPWHLNERFVLLLASSVVFGLCYGVMTVLQSSRKRAASGWPKQKTTLYAAAITKIKATFKPFILGLLVVAPLTMQVNVFFGRWFWRKVVVYSGGLARPFVINFARTNKEPVGFGFVLDLMLIELMTLAAFEIPAAVFEAYSRHPLDFSLFTARGEISPDRYLLHGLRSNDDYYLNFTAKELADAARSSTRRKAVFSDVSNRNPTLWVDLWQTIMLHLGQSHTKLLTRNGRTTPMAIVQPASSASAAPDAHAIKIVQDDIFRPGARAAAAAPPNSAIAFLQTAISLSSSVATSLSAIITPLVRKTPVVVPKQVDEAVAKLQAVRPAVQSEVQQLQGTIEQRLASSGLLDQAKSLFDISEASGAEWAYREIDFVLAGRHVDQCLFKALTSYIIGSRTEDQFGQVQRTIPATLEALARHHAALAGYKAETLVRIEMLAKGSTSWQRGAEQVYVREMQLNEQQVVQSIKAIATAFGQSLDAFRFPPKIAEILASACQ